MKAKKILFIIACFITLVIAIAIVCLIFLHFKFTKRNKILTDSKIANLSLDLGKRKKFYTDAFIIQNIDEVPHLFAFESSEKNFITDDDFFWVFNTLEGFSNSPSNEMKKISVVLAPNNEEYKLIEVRVVKERTSMLSLQSFILPSASLVEAIVEDSKGKKYAMRNTHWHLFTDPGYSNFKATLEKSKEVKEFNRILDRYKINPNTEVETKYCGNKTGMFFTLKGTDTYHFNVESRMAAVLENAFNPNEIKAEKLFEQKNDNVICYKIKFNQVDSFLKATYILPATIYGHWDN